MAHTTKSIIDEPVDMERLYRLYENELTPGQAAELESLSSQNTITIEVKSGCVMDVKGIPDGYDYEIIDYDVDPEPEPEALYLCTVNILVRAKSPGHATDTLRHILDGNWPMGCGIIIDWDYAVQDGERQHPKCVNLDLEPENITELLDHIASQGD